MPPPPSSGDKSTDNKTGVSSLDHDRDFYELNRLFFTVEDMKGKYAMLRGGLAFQIVIPLWEMSKFQFSSLDPVFC